MNPFFKNIALWLVICLILLLIFNIFSQGPTSEKEFIFSDFWARAQKGEVAEVTMRPENSIELSGEDAARMQRLLDVLEDLDDVQNVFHNAEISE